jgi:hypothetical protein
LSAPADALMGALRQAIQEIQKVNLSRNRFSHVW